MATCFDTLPIVDLALLSAPSPSSSDLSRLSQQLHDVFATTGFAYLINAPLSFSHDEVFGLARDFFSLDQPSKMKLAKCSFVSDNRNTYRGYFPPQPGHQDNLKEGFEVGSSSQGPRQRVLVSKQKLSLAEPNVWPEESEFPSGRCKMEQLHGELQALASSLLSLLAVSLGEDAGFFASYLVDSLSTLRLLHYPPQATQTTTSRDSIRLCCTPHTDSGILTLLHQDPTGGLEVRSANGEWVAAPYLSGSIVVNIGDLLADVSGGRFVATMHRVRVNTEGGQREYNGMGRLSVPFFFEPGENCIVHCVEEGGGEGILYGAHVRRKMGMWVEFQDQAEENKVDSIHSPPARTVSEVMVA